MTKEAQRREQLLTEDSHHQERRRQGGSQTLNTDLGRLLNRGTPPHIRVATSWRFQLEALGASNRGDTVLAQKFRNGLNSVAEVGVRELDKDSGTWRKFKTWFTNPTAIVPVEAHKFKREHEKTRKRRGYFTHVSSSARRRGFGGG